MRTKLGTRPPWPCSIAVWNSVAMTMGKPPALIETLKISLSASDTKGNIDIAWENVTASVAFSVK